ncbi:hypothetical protein ZOSMA_197G00050 [Zostera marina]|uniref:Uncharacterized protein n=1 Tax=Zostera marina TaxID=29655 RepID=A0A0K9PR03_ZOSMR|nr:hypothetical protein ZOSMA_197G00050 [Zostera marina]
MQSVLIPFSNATSRKSINHIPDSVWSCFVSSIELNRPQKKKCVLDNKLLGTSLLPLLVVVTLLLRKKLDELKLFLTRDYSIIVFIGIG